jgi:hypothetical protein
MNTPILELFQLGIKKNYEFHFNITEDKTNLITINNKDKIITASIGDSDAVDLPKMINDAKMKLE